jgi:hypothetical protein
MSLAINMADVKQVGINARGKGIKNNSQCQFYFNIEKTQRQNGISFSCNIIKLEEQQKFTSSIWWCVQIMWRYKWVYIFSRTGATIYAAVVVAQCNGR